MIQTANINLPILQEGDKYTKDIQNQAFIDIDREIKGLNDKVHLLDNVEGSMLEIHDKINTVENAVNNKIDIVDNKVTNIETVTIPEINRKIELLDNAEVSVIETALKVNNIETVELPNIKQNISTVEQNTNQNTLDITALSNSKVDKVEGKQLSTNDFDDRLKQLVEYWENFKANGGEIGGDVSSDRLTVGYEQYKKVRFGVDSKDNFSIQKLSKDCVWENNILEEVEGVLKVHKDVYFGGFSKSANGYTKLPNGLILQWGYITISGTGHSGEQVFSDRVTFPIQFNNVLSLIQTCSVNSYDVGKITKEGYRYDLLDNSGYTPFVYSVSAGGWHTKIRYFAIGY